MIQYETERLLIRNFNTNDWKELQKMIIQYQSSEYAKYDHPWPTNEDEIKKITEWFASGEDYLAVTLKDSNKFIGFVSLNKTSNKYSLDLGYVFNSEYHGKGFSTEACKMAINHAFNNLKIETVLATTAFENIPSRRLLERLGFNKKSENMASFPGRMDEKPFEFLAYTYELFKEEWMNKHHKNPSS